MRFNPVSEKCSRSSIFDFHPDIVAIARYVNGNNSRPASLTGIAADVGIQCRHAFDASMTRMATSLRSRCRGVLDSLQVRSRHF
jgi:hypothetical protein